MTLATTQVPAASASAAKVVGSLAVTECSAVDRAGSTSWCGQLTRLWDPQDASLGTFALAFAVVVPDGAPVSAPAVVALEGGPGFGGIASGQSFADMLGPLLQDRTLVLMDARGTGASSAVRCSGLSSGGRELQRAVAACGERLGPRSDLYGSAMAADDLRALVDALGLGPVDVYGDSYGTFLAQVFAGRHPAAVRSLVLDGAYPVTGETAWYPTQGPALRNAFDVVCARTPSCRRLAGSTVSRLRRVLDIVRADVIRVVAPGADRHRHDVLIDAASLVDVSFGGTFVPTMYREMDAALRAALHGDWLPLGRLVAEYEFSTARRIPATEYSLGQSLAVTCHDYPQLYSMDAAPAARRGQFASAVRDMSSARPRLYGPFGVREYVASSWSEQGSCLSWPVAVSYPWQLPGPTSGSYPSVPTLVISGQLDSITTTAEASMVAHQFPVSRHVVVANGLHVAALGDVTGCASGLVRRFLLDPTTVVRQSGGSCAAPTIRGMPSYPRESTGLGAGFAGAQTVADVIDRYYQTDGTGGLGLRGGSWKYAGYPVVRMVLSDIRLYADLPVSGTVRWNTVTGELTTRLVMSGRTWVGGWNTYSVNGMAVMSGKGGGSSIDLRFPAP